MVLAKKGIPTVFSNHPDGGKILHEWDLRVHDHARLMAKFLVFKTERDLSRFWKKAISGNVLGRHCPAVVNDLARTIEPRTGKSYLRVDPRYFCVMGFVQWGLTMEIITHEAVHAGFYYARRIQRNTWPDYAKDDWDEQVCYPAGRIARSINRIAFERGLYPKKKGSVTKKLVA